mgnify:CR=1 FL=1
MGEHTVVACLKDEKLEMVVNDIKNKYATSHDEECIIKDYIRCGTHFDDICCKLSEDLEYVLGDDYRKKLMIPPVASYPKQLLTNSHSYWVYHLLLAKNGKIDQWCILGEGYHLNPPYGIEESRRFAKRLEVNLKRSGINLNMVELKNYGLGFEGLTNSESVIGRLDL